MLHLRDDVKPLFAGLRSVDDFIALEGEVYKAVVPARRILRIARGGRWFFLKVHYGVGWREIIKNLLRLSRPVLGARDEWQALHALARLGIDAPVPVAYGEAGWNPARRRSFVLTEAIEDTQDLEHWLPALATRRSAAPAATHKRRVLGRVAAVAQRMHGAGINHRDFYLCHLRVAAAEDHDVCALPESKLYVMDLHRAQQRRRIPARWRAKDLAALLYSALAAPGGPLCTRRDLARFMAGYCDLPWRRALNAHLPLWCDVLRRTRHLLRRSGHGAQGLDAWCAALQRSLGSPVRPVQ